MILWLTLMLIPLLLLPTIAGSVPETDNSNKLCHSISSCRGRCYERWTPARVGIVSESTFGHLRCRCDKLCILYGDCCNDFTSVCRRQASWWERVKLITKQKYLKCQGMHLEGQTEAKNVMVIGSCPDGTDVFRRVMCMKPPSFKDIPTFIPVTSTADGLVYRNSYCAQCVSKSTPVKPWKVTYVECDEKMELTFEGVALIDPNRASTLAREFSDVLLGWLTSNCRLRFDPHNATNFHFCHEDLKTPADPSACPGPYDPVWFDTGGGKSGDRNDKEAGEGEVGRERASLKEETLFRNLECAKENGFTVKSEKHCLTDSKRLSFYGLLRRNVAPSEYAFLPGSLTILLNFGVDGKTRVNMVDEGRLASMRRCPKGSVLETASNTCKKLHCPSGTTLMEDGSCKDYELDMENLRFETRVYISLDIRYDTTVIPELVTPNTEKILKVNFEKYLHIDETGMLNFSMKAHARASESGHPSGETSITAECTIELEIVLKDESQNDVLLVQEMFDDFNRNLTRADKSSEALKITRISEKITHLVVPDENATQEIQELQWCSNGDMKFYNESFDYWQEEREQPGGGKKNETFVRTHDTGIVYNTGQFDMAIAVQTDLTKDEYQVVAWVVVCERHPRIVNRDCDVEVILNSTEFRYLKNRSIEVLSDHQIYGIDEYEKCPTIRRLVPAARMRRAAESDSQLGNDSSLLTRATILDRSSNTGKILVCLRSPKKEKEMFFFSFSATQGMITVILLPISIVALIATMAIYAFFRRLRNLPGLILLHVAFTLLLSQSTVLFSLTYPAAVSWTCTVIAVANHYLLITSFCWMNAYAYNIYHIFRSFTSVASLGAVGVKHWLRRYALYAYGAPALLVSVCVALESTIGCMHYGGDNLVYTIKDLVDAENQTVYGNACWINNYTASVFVFGLPLMALMTANIALYVLTVRHVKGISRAKLFEGRVRSSLVPNSDSPVDLKTFMRLSTVMGFGWLIGFSGALIKRIDYGIVGQTMEEIVSFLFIFLSSLQGLGIFIAFATGSRVKEEVKEAFKGSRFEGGWDLTSRRQSKDSVTTVSSLASLTSSDGKASYP